MEALYKFNDDWDALVTQSYQDMESEGVLALSTARAIHWRAGEAFALLVFGMCLGYRGQYARALTLLHESLALVEEIAHTSADVLIVVVDRHWIGRFGRRLGLATGGAVA